MDLTIQNVINARVDINFARIDVNFQEVTVTLFCHIYIFYFDMVPLILHKKLSQIYPVIPEKGT